MTPDQCRWIIGGTDHPIPEFDWIPQPHPANIEVTHDPEGQALGPMLVAGEIDALISVDVPQSILDRSPQVARLFPDYETVKRAYYQRTRHLPDHARRRHSQRASRATSRTREGDLPRLLRLEETLR